MLNFNRVSAPTVSAILAISCLPALSRADSKADGSAASAAASEGVIDEIIVTARRLNEAREGIETKTGASTYTINSAALAAAPGGDNTLLNQVWTSQDFVDTVLS